ncbi:similar to Saccharomyces cerevisiae YDL045C FAD1 Flavin adenine dinucleotide (FAD) synthetase, performs the second step in synthesis of FAD from riboflavin [Maudiozyma saulgeensis]|uniref:FAD synthase n=1 Tax=Maudiozyma saulgeensis TaxID=1789683 RepID=A0A1X7R3M5_9SACH|nr:similar to Saccharomyces cerevisiae YDL045C FAD1 Flavin adenine dinucleotide (FAD) synthetase, performs the second step in synthesis of FAD from riboflavin [Kazachstania saulgeensis]
MSLGEIAERCYNMTTSYLEVSTNSIIIRETQDAVRLTRRHLLEDVFTRWSPLNGEISFSYNGGKDCQVLLLLYLSCLWEFFIIQAERSQYDFKYQKFPMENLFSVYIDLAETFPTLESFVNMTSERYQLSLYSSMREHGTKASNMSCAFGDFLKRYPETQAILIGVRATDPFGDTLTPIQKTDSNWPDFYRVQPILHWKLANIWSFLLYSNEPICGLYGNGFTSIGGIDTTIPNPYLTESKDNRSKLPLKFQWEIDNAFKKESDEINVLAIDREDQLWLKKLGPEEYLPGWYLIDDEIERAGRIKK